MDPYDLYQMVVATNPFALAGLAAAVITYAFTIQSVWTRKLEQNLATFFLWGLLDAVVAGSIIFFDSEGNWLLPAGYVICAAAICLVILLRSRTFEWTWLEWMITAFVLISIAVWASVGNTAATIVSTVAGCVATIPLIVDSWRKPYENASPMLYVGFTIANGLSIFGGKDWSVAERLYPTTCTVLTACIVLMVVYRRRSVPKPT